MSYTRVVVNLFQKFRQYFRLRDILLFGVVSCFLLLTGYAYYNHTYSVPFADEDDNFAAAKYMLTGEKLYGEIFSHHQPMSYLISAGIQSATQIDNINLLISRHRQFMILWSVLWCLFLLIRFRSRAFPFIFLYELSKWYLLGNSFLAESLVVYPLIYLSFIAVSTAKLRLRPEESFFIGLNASLSLLLLSAIWPLIAVLICMIGMKAQIKSHKIYSMCLLGFLLPLIVTLRFISSVQDYFYNVFHINLTYYIAPASQIPALLQAIVTPFALFLPDTPGTQTVWILRVIVIILGLLVVYRVQKKAYKHMIILTVLLGLANMRYVQPGLQLYEGFHLLPWYGLTFALIGDESIRVLKEKSPVLLRKSILVLLLSVSMLSLWYASHELFPRVDKEREAYIHYSRQFTIGEAVRILNTDNTLFVAGAEPLIYWQSGAKHATRFIFYYQWMAQVPDFHREVDEMFKKNPATFLYCPCSTFEEDIYGVTKPLAKYQAVRGGQKPTQLFILKSNVPHITEEQRERLSFFTFSL